MKEEVVPEELQAEIQRLRIQNQRMAERIAYLERLLWGGKRDKRVAQGPTLFDAFFNEAADAREAAIAETVQERRLLQRGRGRQGSRHSRNGTGNQEGGGEAPRLRAEEAGASGTLSVHGASGRMADGISQGHQPVGI